MIIYSKNIYFPNQIVKEGYLTLEDGVIKSFSTDIGDEDYEDYENYLIIPGFIDQHLHGWGTGSFGSSLDEASILKMKENLPSVGVTSFLATSGADDLEQLVDGIKAAGHVLNTQNSDGASLLGVHLEGPFVSDKRAGMMNKAGFLAPTIENMKEFVKHEVHPRTVKLMTMAPELDGAKDVISYCNDQGIQVAIGHSDATFDEIASLKEYGIGGVTHMYSGMRGFHHRELGVVGAALYFDDLYCEFAKQTGWTVMPEAFSLAYQLKGADRIIMATDNGAIAQLKKERYHYIRKQTFIPDGDYLIIRDDDGTEARYNRHNYEEIKDLELGYIYSIQNLIENVNPSIHDVIKMTSENCAKYLGVYDRKGSLEVGKDADILVVDRNFNLKATYCMGEKYV